MLLLIALSSFATIALAVIAFAQRPPDPVRVRALALDDSTPGQRTDDRERPMLRIVRPFAGGIIKVMPHRWFTRIERMLVQAGEPIDINLFLVLWVVVALAALAIGRNITVPAMIIFGLVGAALPFTWLRRRVKERQKKIQNGLPDALDLLVTSIEAGLGLDAALVRVGEATDGPLGEEVSRTLREMAVGRPRHDALLELGTRSGVRDLDALIRPVVQAERSGVSIGSALRVQAEDLRVRRRQRAEEYARKIPVKMVMITAIFFVPAVIVLAGGASLTALIESFSSWG